jgi:hypothetical protein
MSCSARARSHGPARRTAGIRRARARRDGQSATFGIRCAHLGEHRLPVPRDEFMQHRALGFTASIAGERLSVIVPIEPNALGRADHPPPIVVQLADAQPGLDSADLVDVGEPRRPRHRTGAARTGARRARRSRPCAAQWRAVACRHFKHRRWSAGKDLRDTSARIARRHLHLRAEVTRDSDGPSTRFRDVAFKGLLGIAHEGGA